MKTLIDGLMSLLSHGGAQTKKAAYLLVVVASVTWLSVDLRHGITEKWIAVYGLLLTAVTSGYLGGKKIEKTTGTETQGGQG
jgi:hypothetical protein